MRIWYLYINISFILNSYIGSYLVVTKRVGFRFDEQLRCPTSITMAWARKSYAFRSSSQTHDALFMAPLLKMQRCRKDDRWQNDWRCPRGQRDSRWHPACLQCDRSPGRRDEDTLLREVDLRQLVEKAQLSVELDTMCLESAFELQAGTSAHTKRSLIEW